MRRDRKSNERMSGCILKAFFVAPLLLCLHNEGETFKKKLSLVLKSRESKKNVNSLNFARFGKLDKKTI